MTSGVRGLSGRNGYKREEPHSAQLRLRITKVRATALVVLLLVVFFLVPLVPYVQPVSVPGVYSAGYGQCIAAISQTNITLAALERQSCETKYTYPPASLLGFATPAYGLLNYGSAPFPTQKLVTYGNRSALAFFDGSRLMAVEDAGGVGVLVNPSQVVDIAVAQVTSFDFGFLNITVQFMNYSPYPLDNSSVYLSMAGFSSNETLPGVVVIAPRLLGTCAARMAPGQYCTVSTVAPNNLPVNRTFNFYPEVRGSSQGTPFLYREGFEESYPRGGVGPIWVKDFIDQLDRVRGGVDLVEEPSLDAFAALRFKNAAKVYQTSDYGFTADAEAFFGQNRSQTLVEVLLYPGIFSPDTYPTFLSDYAPGHWAALINTDFTKFGYFEGVSTYYAVSVPCPIYEIPGPGINIPQFFAQHGCTTTPAPMVWLVIILST